MNFQLGQNLIKQKQFGKALDIFLDLKKNSSDIKILFYLGKIYFELNNFNKSIFYYKKFLKKKPDSINALYNLAIVNQSVGKIESAKKIYLELIKVDTNKIRAYYGLFTLSSDYITDDNYKDILSIKANQKLSLYEEGIINFILSKKEKKNQNYQKEIKYLNDFHLNVFNSNHTYNTSSQFYYNNIISKFYNKLKIIKNCETNIEDNKISPIFIIGLPRSGSTLIESILTSSKEKIYTYGESHVFNMSILDQIGPLIYKKNFNIDNFEFQIDVRNLNEAITKRYSQFNKNSNKKSLVFVDKSLENFFNIEMILNVFPKAKFIHTFRNSLDSIISIYQSMLPELSWTHTIENILIYLNNYHKVLHFFKLKYPGIIMDINLEKFTENNEEVTKEVYKFCNLNWDRETLDFYKRDDLYSKTLSFKQIRKKISKYDDKKYQPYHYLLCDFKKKYGWLKFK